MNQQVSYPRVRCDCGEEFFWAISAATGSKMPVNVEPAKDGNISNPGKRFGLTMYTSHFASCKDAAKHRRRT